MTPQNQPTRKPTRKVTAAVGGSAVFAPLIIAGAGALGLPVTPELGAALASAIAAIFGYFVKDLRP